MTKKALPMIAALTVAMAAGAVTTTSSAAGTPKSNQFWWPEQVDLSPLRQHSKESSPMGADFDYAAAFASLDLDEVKQDIAAVLTDSKD